VDVAWSMQVGWWWLPGLSICTSTGRNLASQRVKALDGVTTALELEIGAPDVAAFLKAKEGHSLIHYGTFGQPCGGRERLVFGAPLPAGYSARAGRPTDLPGDAETKSKRIRQRAS